MCLRVTALVFRKSLTGLVADVQAREIKYSHWTHRHAPLLHGDVNAFRCCSFDQTQLRFAAVVLQHSIADEAITNT